MKQYQAGNPQIQDILSNPEAIIALSKYIEDTGRFKNAEQRQQG
jgi:hypothetical protein